MVAGGDAIARDGDGRVVFVDGALPRERVLVELTDDHSRHAKARVVEVLEASPERVLPPCPEVARGCGACGWQHIDLDAQRGFKAGIVREALVRLGRVDPPALRETVALEPWTFRTTVRAAVVHGRAGFRRAHSHDSLAVDACLVAHPRLAELLIDGRFPGAEEVVLRCGARTGERLAVTTPRRAGREVPDDVRDDHVHEHAAGRSWRVSAASFFQSRPDGVDALAALVADAAGEMASPTTALDLYSGVGIFAGVLAERGWSVTALEGGRAAHADARANLRKLGVHVARADVTTATLTAADLVVADPSRTGLGRAGVATIATSAPQRIVLVSCDAANLGRDAGLLRDAGYRLTSVTPVDLFPHTPHVEVVTVYDR
jgi:23S rRNA (uracil1939-C5)-methyltransferase